MAMHPWPHRSKKLSILQAKNYDPVFTSGDMAGERIHLINTFKFDKYKFNKLIHSKFPSFVIKSSNLGSNLELYWGFEKIWTCLSKANNTHTKWIS